MRKLVIIVAGVLVLAFPVTALAGVAGSDHDLTGSGEKLCFACHIPHNALGDKLWARTPSGTFSGVQDLCYTCHDGGVTSVGATTAFDASLQQHKVVGTDCSGDDACHDVHNQNPNGSGGFLIVTSVNGSFCEACHDATPFTGAEALGDHTAGSTHPYGVAGTGGTLYCEGCHTGHGAVVQTTNPVGLTHPVLLADNQPGSYYGAFCISCHNGTAPDEAVAGTGGVSSADPYDYAEATNDGNEWMHPTISTTGITPVGGCNKCHDPHDPTGTDYGYILMADNANSAYCVSCHNQAGAPGVGVNTHFTGQPSDNTMNQGLSPALPWANQIDEDGTVGADWSTATANQMVCESCHSVHRQGFQTTPSYLLRDDNSNNQICQACHTDN
ncbi:MAG TPA: cytochrome c3 family protein [Acidobacteriota bacterium]|nr:cytochrome c3 family protein [Acidobacteriota bacterium]